MAKPKRLHYYTIRRTVYEFYSIEASSKEEALELLGSEYACDPFEVTVKTDTVIEIQD